MTGSQNLSPLQPLFASFFSDAKVGFYTQVEEVVQHYPWYDPVCPQS